MATIVLNTPKTPRTMLLVGRQHGTEKSLSVRGYDGSWQTFYGTSWYACAVKATVAAMIDPLRGTQSRAGYIREQLARFLGGRNA